MANYSTAVTLPKTLGGVPFLTPNRIDRVRNYVDIIDVVEKKVWLRRNPSGKYYSGLCPFEKKGKPDQFIVSPSLQIYTCLGCKDKGNLFKFVMKTEKVTFIESVIILAMRYRVPIYG